MKQRVKKIYKRWKPQDQTSKPVEKEAPAKETPPPPVKETPVLPPVIVEKEKPMSPQLPATTEYFYLPGVCLQSRSSLSVELTSCLAENGIRSLEESHRSRFCSRTH